ncbi:MAG: ribose 5-phosphate isomerase B [Syntrophobacteraceae bacterium]|jgi:ribose 5-phosphate isomerase B|nr:ribose 5-phosphate isomerase B [Syntrophobacteraceae bacterium]
MKIMIACDHAGLELKQKLASRLRALRQDVEDVGAHDDRSVDYPDYAARVARAVASGEVDRGVLVCGSGIGMCMTANRFRGVRAAQVSEPLSARMSRRHNDSNVLCLGGRFIGETLALEILEAWLAEPFEGGRHQRRLDLIEGLSGT